MDRKTIQEISYRLQAQYELSARMPPNLNRPVMEIVLSLRLKNKDRLECLLKEYQGRFLTTFVNDVFKANKSFEDIKINQNFVDVRFNENQIQEYHNLLTWQCKYNF